MFFRLIYDDRLAQAAYLIGCQQTGEAIVIDPERDIDRYLQAAEAEDLRITAAAETHIHADYLTGARELAERGVKVYLSDEGDADWKYRWLDKKQGGGLYEHQLLRNGDTFRIGYVELKVLHTPGHTPEHICFLVTDRGGGASEPMGVLTGDFVFVGDVGRPDLLEAAVGVAGAAEAGARVLHSSTPAFLDLPDYLQVWPAHGAGSACGKALGAVPQSTVGYEKRFNPALAAAEDEGRFLSYVLEGQPEPPLYYARMKRENKSGPALLGDLPQPRQLGPGDLATLDPGQTAIIDTRPWEQFREAHLRGSLWSPLNNYFPPIVGSYVDPNTLIYLVAEESDVEEAVRCLVRIGLDEIAGYGAPEAVEKAGESGTASIPEVEADTAKSRIEDGELFLLDVRRGEEYASGHLEGALNVPHTQLPRMLEQIPHDRPLLVYCRTGNRSAAASALLERHGFDVVNLAEGILAWEKAGGAVAR